MCYVLIDMADHIKNDLQFVLEYFGTKYINILNTYIYKNIFLYYIYYI